jgi:ATP-dependent DNA helicase RecG
MTADGTVLQAGVALFGKEPFPTYPQCGMRFARFRGVNKSEFIDQYQEYGHAFEVLLQAQNFIRRNTRLSGQVRPDRLERDDVPEYPIEAVREALVNAICHRDYSIPGGTVAVAIYDDRLEIINTGTMAPGIHVEDLKRDHVSAPRNPTIAETFCRRGLIEKWGRGTQKILEVCKAAGRPACRGAPRTGRAGALDRAGGTHLDRRPRGGGRPGCRPPAARRPHREPGREDAARPAP